MREAAKERVHVANFGVGASALTRLRGAIEDVCDPAAEGPVEDFCSDSSVRPLDTAHLIESRSTPVRYDRLPRHIARSGFDEYQMSIPLDGELEFSTGRRTVRARPGDVILNDMTETSFSRLSAGGGGLSHGLALVLPRALLAPMLAAPAGSSGLIVSRDTPTGRLIGEHVLALRRRGRQGSAALVAGVAGLLAEAAGSAQDAAPAVSSAARQALLGAIKRHIEANLGSEAIGAAALCRRFSLSRPSLYRLFEAEGGVEHYIQERRLERAFRRLISSAAGEARMIDLAVDAHFSSDTTFIRAFRRRFGLTPGEARALAAARDSKTWLADLGY